MSVFWGLCVSTECTWSQKKSIKGSPGAGSTGTVSLLMTALGLIRVLGSKLRSSLKAAQLLTAEPALQPSLRFFKLALNCDHNG